MKNKFYASLMQKMGIKAKAELNIDDVNGAALTFPDISDVSEIKEGAAISAADGSYTIVIDGQTMTIEVSGGVVTKVTMEEEPAAEAVTEQEEINAVLEAVVDQVEAVKKSYTSEITALKQELSDLKTSLKHPLDAAMPAAKKDLPQFKII